MRKIFINGNFYTLDPIKPIVQAVVVENGRFIAMGSEADILLQWNNHTCEVIDLGGKTVTPGLVDSHLHLSLIAEQFMHLDLTGITSKTEMLEKFKRKLTR